MKQASRMLNLLVGRSLLILKSSLLCNELVKFRFDEQQEICHARLQDYLSLWSPLRQLFPNFLQSAFLSVLSLPCQDFLNTEEMSNDRYSSIMSVLSQQ